VLHHLFVCFRIGWEFWEYGTVSIDQYELHHDKRSKIEMLMPATERMNMLVKEWKVSQRDIIQCIRSSNRVKHQRRQTIVNDQDAFIIKLRQVFKFLKRCASIPVSKFLKNGSQQKASPRWCSEGTTDCLDKTRHRGAVMVEMEMLVEKASEAIQSPPHNIEEISINKYTSDC
jgi:hypothetical protein